MNTIRRPFKERLMEKVIITDSCWLWTGAVMANGYGRMWPAGGRVAGLVHRLSYEAFVGPIPEGLTIDHLCRVKHCVNPLHMESVTSGENTRRKPPHSNGNDTKTECPKGHPYDDANTRVYRGKRHCRACDRLRGASSKRGRYAVR